MRSSRVYNKQTLCSTEPGSGVACMSGASKGQINKHAAQPGKNRGVSGSKTTAAPRQQTTSATQHGKGPLQGAQQLGAAAQIIRSTRSFSGTANPRCCCRQACVPAARPLSLPA